LDVMSTIKNRTHGREQLEYARDECRALAKGFTKVADNIDEALASVEDKG
jgi:hypothetical protein